MLPDLLAYGLSGVIVGTAVASHSAQVGYYYAKPTNKFWKTLHQVGLTPRLLRPSEYPELLDYGIGLTDLVKKQAGMDRTLSRSSFDTQEFSRKIEKFAPTYVCFNGKRGAREYLSRKVSYGLQPERIGETRIFVAHSTSGTNNRWWDIQSWQEFALLALRDREKRI